MKIKVTQKITYLEAKKIQENQPEITFAKVVQSLNTKPETKESSTQFNEKDSVIKANSKVITPTLKPKPKPISTHQSRPPTKSQNSSQTQPTKTSGSQQRSRSRTADQKGKNGKEKDKDKGPNPYSKGASADPIKLVNRFDSLENMELETDSSMFSQSSTRSKRNRPRFNKGVKNSINKRKSALRKFNRQPTKENLIHAKQMRAKARKTIKTAKRTSWQQYVSKLNSRTPAKKIWDMIR